VSKQTESIIEHESWIKTRVVMLTTHWHAHLTTTLTLTGTHVPTNVMILGVN